MKTQHELKVALSKLLTKVRVANNWSENSFKKESEHVMNLSVSEAVRFHKALLNANLIKHHERDRRKFLPNFDVRIWQNEDLKSAIINDILIVYDISRKRNYSKRRKHIHNVEPVVTITEENPLTNFTSEQLVTELRNRGYEVTCSRQIITTETL